MYNKLKLPTFESQVASTTAIIPRLPRGNNAYAGIVLELGGTFTQAQCSNIRVNANGKTIFNMTGTHLDSLNNYDRLKDTATFLLIPFADFTVQDDKLSQVGSLDTTRGIEELSLEVDIGAATSPTLKAFGLMLPPSAANDRFAGMFKSTIKATHSPAAAGQFSLPVPVGSKAGGFLKRASFFHTNVTSLAVKRDGLNLQDDLTIAEVNYMNELRWRTTVSGLTVFDPLSQQYPEGFVPTLRDKGDAASFEWFATVSAADTVTSYTEIVAPLANI